LGERLRSLRDYLGLPGVPIRLTMGKPKNLSTSGDASE